MTHQQLEARRVPGTPSVLMTEFDLAPHGYVREEWFVTGRATSYSGKHLTGDGRWSVTPDQEASYTTRLVVVRPTEEARFSGTAVVEWLNVSGGRDAAPDWLFTHREIVRRGQVWVGVTAQKAGVDGGGLRDDQHLRRADPDRYAELEHPGDAFSFDIYGQAAAAVRQGGALVGGLRPTTVLATGESQSAIFLTTYVNAIDPLDRVVDGVLLHGRSVRGAWLDGTLWDVRRLAAETMRRPSLPGHLIRDDARVPVLTVQSETDVVLMLSGLARQPDSDRFRLWEVAGASHFDMYGLRAAYRDDGLLDLGDAVHRLAEDLQPISDPRGVRTSAPVNCGPQQHYVLQAALRALESWVREGEAPASAPRISTRAFQPLRLRRDAMGLALGGVRTPFVEAPVHTLSGLGQTTPGFGLLFGSTHPFTAGQLARRYPGGIEEYVEDFTAASRAAVAAGFLVPEDEAEILALGARIYPTGERPTAVPAGG